VRENIIDVSKVNSNNNSISDAVKVWNETVAVNSANIGMMNTISEDLVLRRMEVDRVDRIPPVVAFPTIIIRMLVVDPQPTVVV
jgi:hypothetical protein